MSLTHVESLTRVDPHLRVPVSILSSQAYSAQLVRWRSCLSSEPGARIGRPAGGKCGAAGGGILSIARGARRSFKLVPHDFLGRFLASKVPELKLCLPDEHIDTCNHATVLFPCIFDQQGLFRVIDRVKDDHAAVDVTLFVGRFIYLGMHANGRGVDQDSGSDFMAFLPGDRAAVKSFGECIGAFVIAARDDHV